MSPANTPPFLVPVRRLARVALLGTVAVSTACHRGAAPNGPNPIPVPREAHDAGARTGRPEYDVVIRNGRVLDGMGNPVIFADVAIRDGRFVKIGRVNGKGEREIDARGLYVSPGWIDVMDQSGGVLLKNGNAESKLLQGVTTAIGGEGGFPVSATDIPTYFGTLEKQGISINFGSYYSEAQARVGALQYSARKPNAAELERMKASMDTAMRNGAMGMTTALIYPPGSYAETAELPGG
jgi:N-acyl-D-amino-acid deacylase